MITTDGEFDVYRYQSLIFSVVVGAALLAGGVTQLSSFEIPPTLLGVLGLSQVIYIGGKLVTPTTMTDLNSSIEGLKVLERQFKDAVYVKKAGLPTSIDEARALAPERYANFVEKAKDVSILYRSMTGSTVEASGLEPSFD